MAEKVRIGALMFVQAFSYKRWADDRTLGAVNRIDKNAQAESYALALQQINHMVIVEELFESRLIGEAPPHPSTNTDLVPGLDELASRLGRSNDWYINYAASFEHRGDVISFAFADGRRGAMSVEEILFHIITHGSYHRGNIARILDLAGVPHPVDGYGIYIHEKEPQRREN